MPSRENQGLQAALIVFVLITIALAVTTYVYFRKSEEEGARATAAEQKSQESDRTMRQALDERNRLKEMLGFEGQEMPAIEKRFTEEMAQFGADYPATDPKNYRTLPDYMMKAALARSTSTTEAETRERQAQAEKAAAEKRAADERTAMQQQMTQTVALYDSERQAFNADRARVNNLNQQLQTTLRTKDQEIAKVKADSQSAVDRYATQIADLEKVLEGLRALKREQEQTNFETASGRITYVNQAQRTVWINLGVGDGLQRHTTFSVYDQDVHEYAPNYVKGEIEVTKLIDRHLAEARILTDDNKNPIVNGDLIYTPAWRPGVFMHFAVAGFIDINGDGLEDKELLRNIIHTNGGVIDAEVDEAGNVVGQLTPSTRYLIIGERPGAESGEAADAARKGFGELYGRANQLGIEFMPLPRFLALMGYKAGSKTVQIGGRGAGAPQGAGQQPPAAAPATGPAPRGAAPAGGGAAPPANGADPFRPRVPPRGPAGAF